MSTGRNPLVERFGLETSDVGLSEGAPPVHRQLAGRGSVGIARRPRATFNNAPSLSSIFPPCKPRFVHFWREER
jgi:hypothetical protein